MTREIDLDRTSASVSLTLRQWNTVLAALVEHAMPLRLSLPVYQAMQAQLQAAMTNSETANGQNENLDEPVY